MSNSRYKPVGWRKDSHRHYLAAKYGSAGYYARNTVLTRFGRRVSGAVGQAFVERERGQARKSLGAIKRVEARGNVASAQVKYAPVDPKLVKEEVERIRRSADPYAAEAARAVDWNAVQYARQSALDAQDKLNRAAERYGERKYTRVSKPLVEARERALRDLARAEKRFYERWGELV